MIAIPAIDIMDGKCVRLLQGNFHEKTEYASDPVAVAQSYEDAGITHVHLVDLDGARNGQVTNWQVLEHIAQRTNLSIDFSGGLYSTQSVDIALKSGAAQVTIGTAAAKHRQLFLEWIDQFGPDQIILGADVLDGHISISGWREQTEIDIMDFISDYVAAGIRYVMCTDISKDGMLDGPATSLYRQILKDIPGIRLIASGGVSHIDQLAQLQATGVHGVIVGKALYEGNISLSQLLQAC